MLNSNAAYMLHDKETDIKFRLHAPRSNVSTSGRGNPVSGAYHALHYALQMY